MSKYITLALLVIGWGIGNTYKFSYLSQDVNMTVLDLVIFLITLGQILVNRQKVVGALHQFKFVVTPLLFFIISALASLFSALGDFSPTALLVGSLYLARWIIYSLFFASLIQIFKQKNIEYLLHFLALTTIATCLAQYLYYPDVRSLAAIGWDDHYYRVVGTFLDPGFTGLILVFILTLFLLKPLRNKAINLVAWCSAYLAFALTYSRSSYLAYVVAMIFLSWKRKSWKLATCTLILLFVTLPVLPRASDGEGVKLERTNSIQARIDNWKNSLVIWKDNPLVGVGFNVYRYAQNNYGFLGKEKWISSHAGAGADSSLLFVGATTGLIGFIGYLWYLKRISEVKLVSYFMAPLLIHSLFLNSLFYSYVLLWLSIIVAYTLQPVLSEPDSRPDQ